MFGVFCENCFNRKTIKKVMTIILCIDFHRKPMNWESPVIPRIGKKLFTGDFFPTEELSKMEDYLVVRDVIWHKEKKIQMNTVLVCC